MSFLLHAVSKRKKSSKIFDTFLVIGGVILASVRVGELKLTNGNAPLVENEFELLSTGNSTIYSRVLQTMLEQVTRQDDIRTYVSSDYNMMHYTVLIIYNLFVIALPR